MFRVVSCGLSHVYIEDSTDKTVEKFTPDEALRINRSMLKIHGVDNKGSIFVVISPKDAIQMLSRGCDKGVLFLLPDAITFEFVFKGSPELTSSNAKSVVRVTRLSRDIVTVESTIGQYTRPVTYSYKEFYAVMESNYRSFILQSVKIEGVDC